MADAMDKYIEALKRLGNLRKTLENNKTGKEDIDKVIDAVVREMNKIN